MAGDVQAIEILYNSYKNDLDENQMKFKDI